MTLPSVKLIWTLMLVPWYIQNLHANRLSYSTAGGHSTLASVTWNCWICVGLYQIKWIVATLTSSYFGRFNLIMFWIYFICLIYLAYNYLTLNSLFDNFSIRILPWIRSCCHYGIVTGFSARVEHNNNVYWMLDISFIFFSSLYCFFKFLPRSSLFSNPLLSSLLFFAFFNIFEFIFFFPLRFFSRCLCLSIQQ